MLSRRDYDLALSWLRVMVMTSVYNIYGTGINTVLWKTVCKQWTKTPNMKDNPEILAPVHVIERPITVYYEDSDKGTVF